MKQFKHKITQAIFNQSVNGKSYYSDKYEGYYIPSELVENSCDYEEVIEKDYEILRWELFMNMDKPCSHIIKTNSENLSLDNYRIHSIKYLPTGEVFQIGDKISFSNSFGVIKLFRVEKEGVYCDLEDCRGLGIGYIKKVKEPILTTEDGVDLFNAWDKYYVPQRKENGDLIGTVLEFQANNFIGDNKDVKRFSTKENAEEYIKQNQKRFSLNDIEKALNFDKPQTPIGYFNKGEFLNRLKNHGI
jgi:hypothetical protein